MDEGFHRQYRYLLGLAAKDIAFRFCLIGFNLALQFIVGTDDAGIVLWAPHSMREFIGRDIGEMITWGNCEVERI